MKSLLGNAFNKLTNKGKFKIFSIFRLFKSSLYVYENNDDIVGCGCIIRKLNIKSLKMDTWIAGIHIIEKYRQQKFGTKLVESLIQKCINNSYNEIYLYVDKDNYKACGLYNKLGFKILCEHKHYYKMEYVIKNNK